MANVLVRVNKDNCGNLIITQLESIGDIGREVKLTQLIQNSQNIKAFIDFHPDVLFENSSGEFEVNDNVEILMYQEEFFCLMGIDY